MAVTNFIPTIWNAALQENFLAQVVITQFSNRQYEGTLARGNTVRIATPVPIAIKDYKAANRQTTADVVSTTTQDLVIDQEKSFDFQIDDIDKIQAAGALDTFAVSAASGLAQDADKFLGALAVTGGTKLANTVAPVDGNAAFNIIRDLRKALNLQNVPNDQRVLLVNPEFESFLLGADSKLTSANIIGDTGALKSATIGNLLGFQIVTTNNLPSVAKPQAVALHRSALAYVSQIDKLEALRNQTSFADRLRGLHVYGGKVVRPTAIQVYTAA